MPPRNQPMPSRPSYEGVLCVPFQNETRPAGEAEDLRRLENWVIEAAAAADIRLVPIREAFDPDQIVPRIFEAIQRAHIVVSMLRETNPNVFFESGYAAGWDKPVLYVVDKAQKVPFDLSGVEYFTYRHPDRHDGDELTKAMLTCLGSRKRRLVTRVDINPLRRHLLETKFVNRLHSECMEKSLHDVIAWIRSWDKDKSEYEGATAILRIGTYILSRLTQGGFATLYCAGQESWEPDRDPETHDEYFEATREAARRVPITRVYVLDTPDQINSNNLRSAVWADIHAGIEVRYILERALPDRPRARDFALWDDELYAEVEYEKAPGKAPRLKRCRYWSDEAHLDTARRWKRIIESKAKPCPDLPAEDLLLAESADAAASDCRNFCESHSHNKADCSAYHLNWQKLRLLGMVSTPNWHADFYTKAFRSWSDHHSDPSETPELNILISGLADYGMLYWIAQSLDKSVRDRCVFHVLDICETPLRSCRWLQRRLERCKPPLSVEIRLHHRDILQSGLASASFDLIASDAFLTRFDSRETKSHVLSEWSNLLRPGGRIVTTARVLETNDGKISKAHREKFVGRALGNLPNNSSLSAPEIEEIAKAYADYIESYPFDGEDDLRSFLHDFDERLRIRSCKVQELSNSEMVQPIYASLELERKP